jgi:hypothetical protein
MKVGLIAVKTWHHQANYKHHSDLLGSETLFILCQSQITRRQGLPLAVSKGSNRVGVLLLSPEDSNRSSFLKVVFHSCLECRMMYIVYKPSDSECNTQLYQKHHELQNMLRGIVPPKEM